jgi:carbon storage regulator
MLVLTRALNESIMIGDQIEITIVDVKGDKVRLGIKAPASVAVHRKEVFLAIQQANVEAAKAAPQSLDALEKMLGKPGTA